MTVSNNNLSISLKDDFDHAACLAASARIQALPGVSNVRYLPQGCFGIDVYRIWAEVAPGSGAEEKIAAMPEVKAVARGYIFP